MKAFLTPLAVTIGLTILVAVARSETAYFLMSGPSPAFATELKMESYVVAVSDEPLIQQARDHLRAADREILLVPHVRIASGEDPVNRNYGQPGLPVWPWRVTALIAWTEFDPSKPRIATTVVIPNVDGAPSHVSQLLAGNPPYQPACDDMMLVRFPLVMELSPDEPANLVNVSTRGHVGVGERVLIAGFTVQGGTPRNVLVRGIGPSLAGLGVAEPLADPKIAIFRGPEMIVENDDWMAGNFTPPNAAYVPWYAWLFPSDPREAALQLSLPPGAYTVHVSGMGETTGVALAEVYDLDALAPHRE